MKDVAKKTSNKYNNSNSRQRDPQGNRRKKRRKKNLTLYYLMVFIVMVIVLVVLSLTVFFNIEKITIIGTSVYSKEDICNVAGVKIGDNMFKKNIEELENKIMNELTNIDYVKITRNLPTELQIEVKPCIPTANLEYEGGYCIISEKCKIMEDKLSAPRDGLVIVQGFEPIECSLNMVIKSQDEKKTDIINHIFEILKSYSFEGITKIDITDRLNITMFYKDRIEIELGSSFDLPYKINFAKTIIESDKISDDFEGKIVMRGDSGVSVIKKEDLEGNS